MLSPLADHLWKDFKPMFETVFSVIKGLISSLKFTLNGLIKFISGTFTGDWQKVWEGIKDIFKGIWNGIASIAEGGLNLIIDGINSLTSGLRSALSDIAGAVGFDINIPGIPHITIPKFETGGYVPSRYTMFMAGENGVPEIDLLKQLLAKETSVNIGDRDIARANLRGQKAMGLQIIT